MAQARPIVFFGSGAFGLPTLRALALAHRVVGVVTQPDKPAGRGGAITPTPIGAWAQEYLSGAPVLKPPKCSAPDVVAQIRSLGADGGGLPAFVVIAFGQKLPRSLLHGRFAINLHASLLPRWRGAAPINAAIVAGDRETGNSVITLAEKMDAGLVLGQTRRPIPPDMTAGELHDLLASDGPELVLRTIAQERAGTLEPATQDEELVTLAPKLSKGDGQVDWGADADACRARINGLSPWPGVAADIGGERVKLLRAGPSGARSDAPPGTLVDAPRGLVACGRGVIEIVDVQPAGKRAMRFAEFARGRALAPHTVLLGGTA